MEKGLETFQATAPQAGSGAGGALLAGCATGSPARAVSAGGGGLGGLPGPPACDVFMSRREDSLTVPPSPLRSSWEQPVLVLRAHAGGTLVGLRCQGQLYHTATGSCPRSGRYCRSGPCPGSTGQSYCTLDKASEAAQSLQQFQISGAGQIAPLLLAGGW